MKMTPKIFLAIILTAVSGFFGIFSMIKAEDQVLLTSDQIGNMEAITHMVTQGLTPYFLGFGMIVLFVGIAFVLVDYENETTTTLVSEKKE